MRRDLDVFVGEQTQRVGRLRFEHQGRREFASFEYDGGWLRSGFPIDPNLAWTTGPQFPNRVGAHSPFGGVFADNEPDGWGRRVILRQHRKAGVEPNDTGARRIPLTSMDYLLYIDDFARIGALRFRDETGVFQRSRPVALAGIPPHLQLGRLLRASLAFERSSESADELNYLLGRGTSLGGIRPKCVVEDAMGVLYVGKFPSVHDDRPVAAAEVLALHLAQRAGIRAADGILHQVDTADVAVIRRFDRNADGTRIAYISARTMLGATDSDAEPHSYVELADAIRKFSPNPESDLKELWRRIAFNVLITNIDDHLANHGFLQVGTDQWQLSPAFDINPFPDRIREFKTWLSPQLGPDARIEPVMELAQVFGLLRGQAKEILGEVEAGVSLWRSTGRGLGLSGRDLDVLADAFEHEELAVARRVVGR